jgi:cytochrome P450
MQAIISHLDELRPVLLNQGVDIYDLKQDDYIKLAASVIALVLLLKFIQVMNRPRLRNVPAVKGGWPYMGQALDMIKGSPWDSMTKWAGEYGGIFTFHLFGSDAICISDTELLKEVLHSQMTIFQKDTAWTYKPFLVILGNGLVTSHGKEWRRQRVLLSNHLRIEILDEIPGMALQAVERLSVKLDKVAREGGTIEMAEEFRSLTLQVISEALLSISAEESDETFAKMYLPIVEEGNLRTWDPTRMYIPGPAMVRHWLAVKRLNDYVSGLIRKRWDLRTKEASDSSNTTPSRRQDVLDKVMSAIKPEDWCEGAVRQIRDEIKTFVLAGHETSASMLAWTLYELHADGKETCSAIKQKVLKEGESVFGVGSGGNYTNSEGHVINMPPRAKLQGQDGLNYTECCLRESLRKYSVVPTVVRLAAEKTTLAGGKYVIPKGATIMVCIQGVHHNPENWPEPMCYQPERFEGDIKPYTFMPFVEGPRNCLGQFLSLLESKCVISMLIRKYNFVLQNPENAFEKHSFMVPIIPKNGHIYKVTKL